MGFLEKINAAPQNVEWVGFHPKRLNLEMYAKLAQDKRKKLIDVLAPDVNLYAFPDKFAALNEDEKNILYLVQFKIANFFGHKSVSQIQVWRNKGVPLTEGIAKKIFFDFLFPLADCVVTDRQQTIYGRAFWELRIAEALAKNFPVYLCDQNTGEKKRVADYDEFLELGDSWWGDEHKYQAKKIAICHTPIFSTP